MPIHGRIMCATNKDLEVECREGRFRPDVYERMNGVRVHMPELRRMLAEAPEEMRYYVRALVAAKVDHPERVEQWTERVMLSKRVVSGDFQWPRNLRELKNYVEQFILTNGSNATPESPPAERRPRPPRSPSDVENAGEPSSEILGEKAKAGEVTVDEATRALVTRIYALNGENTALTAPDDGPQPGRP